MIRQIAGILAGVCGLGMTTQAGEPLVDTDFGATPTAIQGAEDAAISGQLPPGVMEDSAWAEVKVRYEPQADRLGSDLKWVRANIEEITRGRVQLKWMLPPLPSASHFRLTTTLASETKNTVVFQLMDPEPPYTVHWKQTVPLEAQRTTRTFDFQLPAMNKPTALILGIERPGEVDLYSVRLDQRTEEDIARERAEAVAAAPDNLAPNVNFALGLPSGWGTGRAASLTRDVSFGPGSSPGPLGTVPLKIDVLRDGAAYDLYSAPFQVADPSQIHIVSFSAIGSGEGQLKVYCDGKEFGSGNFQASPEGTDVRIPFRVDPMARWIVLHWSGKTDLEIAGLTVTMGRKPKLFSLPRSADVSLAADFSKGNIFINEVDEPKLHFALVGETEGTDLHLRTTDLYGSVREESFPVAELSGEVKPQVPEAAQKFGSFRTEAWLERDGAAVSPVAEVVYHVVPKPVFWGRIAPESKFGNHMNLYEPHLYAGKAMGANWNRFHGGNAEGLTYWNAVEPQKGEWRWHKEKLQVYRDAGFALCGVWARAPYWARSARAEPQMNGWLDNWWQPRDYEEFAEYVRRSATEYAGLIDAWQIWNEPWGEFWFKDWREDLDGTKRWHPGPSPAEDYLTLSKVAWNTFQETGLEASVIGIGATMGERGKKWMEKMLALGAENFCDVLSFHAYFGGGLENGLRPNSETLLNLHRRVFAPIHANEKAATMPVWMTEGSWLQRSADTGMHLHSVPGPHDSLEAVREHCIRPALYHAIQFSEGADKVFTYALSAGPPFFRPIPQGQIDWSALVMPNGEIHPAAAAYAAMALRLEKASFVKRLQIDNQTVAFVFAKDDSEEFLVALFGIDLTPWFDKFQPQNPDDFLGNPAKSGIRHQLLYVRFDSLQAVNDSFASLTEASNP